MNNETTVLFKEKLETLFQLSNFSKLEIKFEKDVEDLEQMKLEFCDIYKRCKIFVT
jgi:hypothetical protein